MRQGRRRRGGWALLELLVVLAAVTALLTMAAGLVIQMLKIDGAERSRVYVAADLDRLARDFRRDVHACAGAADVRADRLVLPLREGRAVEYLVRPRDVLRTTRRGEKIEHREQYRVPPATRGHFASDRAVIAYVLDADPDGGGGKVADPVYRGYRIEAVPGRDARLGEEVPR